MTAEHPELLSEAMREQLSGTRTRDSLVASRGIVRLGVVPFDAHADTADTLDGELASHGTPVRRDAGLAPRG